MVNRREFLTGLGMVGADFAINGLRVEAQEVSGSLAHQKFVADFRARNVQSKIEHKAVFVEGYTEEGFELTPAVSGEVNFLESAESSRKVLEAAFKTGVNTLYEHHNHPGDSARSVLKERGIKLAPDAKVSVPPSPGGEAGDLYELARRSMELKLAGVEIKIIHSSSDIYGDYYISVADQSNIHYQALEKVALNALKMNNPNIPERLLQFQFRQGNFSAIKDEGSDSGVLKKDIIDLVKKEYEEVHKPLDDARWEFAAKTAKGDFSGLEKLQAEYLKLGFKLEFVRSK